MPSRRAASSGSLLDLPQDIELDLQILGSRLDHQVHFSQRGIVGRRRDAREGSVLLGGVQRSFLDEPIQA